LGDEDCPIDCIYSYARTDCSQKGSLQLYESLKQLVKDKNLKDEVKVSKSTCLDDCETGPNVLVYLKGITYNKVTVANLEDIINAHSKQKQFSDMPHHKMLK
jgi:(2Fe-2S) ferredoxin